MPSHDILRVRTLEAHATYVRTWIDIRGLEDMDMLRTP